MATSYDKLADRYEATARVLAERWHISLDEAFTAFRSYARAHQHQLAQLAREIASGDFDTHLILTRPPATRAVTRRPRVPSAGTPNIRCRRDLGADSAHRCLPGLDRLTSGIAQGSWRGTRPRYPCRPPGSDEDDSHQQRNPS
ncbi:hypothetical protein [Streptomyces decoyicus]